MSDQGPGSVGAPGEHYQAFVLRLWCGRREPGHRWRFSLEDPWTRERRGFSNLEDLVVYLGTMVDDARPTANRKEASDVDECRADEREAGPDERVQECVDGHPVGARHGAGVAPGGSG
jgi:hypothetical protein